MANPTVTICDSFKGEILRGIHTHNHNYKMALYKKIAATGHNGVMGVGTTAYVATVAADTTIVEFDNATYGGYGNAGGMLLTPDVVAGNIIATGTGATVRLDTSAGNHYAGFDWANAVWTATNLWSGMNEYGFYALIYNDSVVGKPAVLVAEWQAGDLNPNPNTSTLTIVLPSSGNVVVKIA